MKINARILLVTLTLARSLAASAHDIGAPHGDDAPLKFSAQPPPEIIRGASALPAADSETVRALTARYLSRRSNRPTAATAPQWQFVTTPFSLSEVSASDAFTPTSYSPPAGNGTLMAASFAPFKPKVRYNWDGTTFFVEGDNTPDNMPNKMVGITSWQQQIPLPAAYFASTTNPENSTGSLGYKQPNYWRLPLVPTVAGSPTLIFTPGSTTNNFQRGAIALASNGIAIFNPANNTGRVSYEIGELDYYGGHCGKAEDYHYHIIPTHLSSRFGGPLSDDKPVAWALDGYPIYSYVEPDGTARQALDSNGGHDIGNGWGYHYHAVGTTATDATHPYGTPQSPYTMTSFKGTVVNFGGQVDGQPELGGLRQDGTGGFNAKPIAGAYIVAFMNPAPLVADGSGNLGLPTSSVSLTGCSTTFGSTTVNCASTTNLVLGMAIVGFGVGNNATVTQINGATQFTISAQAITTTTGQNLTAVPTTGASADQYLMRVNMGGVDYDECWIINRSVNPHTLKVTWRAQALISGALSGPVVTTTTTYTPTAGTADGNRLATYTLAAASQTALPDTGQTLDTTATFGEDADYTIHPQSFTDNGNGTTTDNVTGLMWQKVDNGESTWENAVANAATVNTGGFTDWRLPTPSELFSIFNHNVSNPALNTTFFPNNGAGAADYWWTSDVSGSSTTNVWCTNAGGGLGPKPKTETISTGGVLRYSARYVRGAKPTNAHNYLNNGDGTITDLDTGLMWTQVPGPATTWDAALSYAEGLSLGGFNDWRLPNVKELQTLTDYTLANAVTPVVKASMNQTMFTKTLTNCTTTAGGTTITCADTTGLIPGMPLVDASSVAGTYIPYTTPPVVNVVTSGTTFTVTSGTGIVAGSALTLKALPPPTAFWTSTSQNNSTTNAWVVEFGINNSSSPARNAQGIISYNTKAGTYPVFAVRTTSVATQIAVEQPAGTALTDAVSTVSCGNVNVGSTSTKTFTIRNNGSTTLTLTGVTIDGTSAANFTITSSPSTSITAGASTTMDVRFSAASVGNKVAVLHIASSDTAVGAAFDINLTGTGVIPPPTITNTRTSPNTPTYVDGVWVTAQLAAASGTAITNAQMIYSDGTQTTNTIFAETMSNTATTTGGWDGTGAVYPWTVTSTGGAGNIKQLTLANHGAGNICGVQFDKGTASATATMIHTTNGINASGTAGTIQFWAGTANLTAGLGWNLQLATDATGTNWTTRLSESDGSNHAIQLYSYTLLPSERVSTLRMRFQFIGNGTGGATGPKTYLDDITLVTTTGAPPVSATMYDDGLHGDGLAGDGVYGAAIPVQTAGKVITYNLSVTDSNGSTTTSTTAGTYTVSAVTPPANFAISGVSAVGGTCTIIWPTQLGIVYSVQWSPDLNQWFDIPVGQVGTWTDTTAGSVTKRFYRVSR